MTCDIFASHLGEYLEGGLDAATHAACEAHQRQCPSCATLVAELDHLVTSATQLPLPAPSRDLWPAIEARLDTPVLTITPRVMSTHPFMTWRRLAVAAVALVSVSAGLTWSIARRAPVGANETATVATLGERRTDADRAPSTDNSTTAGDIDPTATDMVDGMPPAVMGGTLSEGTRGGLVASGNGRTASGAPVLSASSSGRVLTLDTLYGREIAMLRTVAETQLGLLDSSTVSVVRRNLDIIDQAIRESRAALAGDPNSGFLLDQLDRAYERKVDLLRRVALL
jgi:hypothetical protein